MSARSLDHDETRPKNAGLAAAATKANSALAIFASIIDIIIWLASDLL
jgi:hypothetical protein